MLSEIKEVRRTRALQRAARKRHGGSDGQSLATVAVVGYTNAVGDQNSPRTALNLTLLQYPYVIIYFSQGKSTLVSSLSDSYLYCDDR